MKNRQTVIPFRGRLTDVVKRRYGKRRKLSEEEILERKEKGLEDRVFIAVRRKEIDALFTVYTHLITPNEFMLKILAKADRFKNYNILLVDKFDEGTKYLRRKFASEMSESFIQDTQRMRAEIEDFEKFIRETSEINTPVDDRIRRIRKYVRKATYKNRLVENYSDLLGRVFKLMGIEVSTKQKRNSSVNLPYIQFALPSSLESALNKSSKDDTEEYDVLKRAFDIQQKELETTLEQQGFVVGKTRDYLGVGGAKTATVAYDPQVKSLGKPPRRPSKRRGESRESYEARVEASGYEKAMKAYEERLEPFIKGIYSPYLVDEETSDYQMFSSKDDYEEAFESRIGKEMALFNQMPTIEEERIQVGVKKVKKRQPKGYEGEDVFQETPVYEYLSKITYEGAEESFPLTRYDVSALSGDMRTAQLTDAKGSSKRALTRVIKVKKMIVGDTMVDVIVEGQYKGFLLEDLVNASGRLIEGSFYTRTADGETQKIEMIEGDFVRNEVGDLVPDGEEVSFLDLGEGSARAKYMKVVNNRLREPYITLSANKKRLVLGIPSSNASKQDRNAIKDLAKIMKPSIEQKKDPRLAPTVNGLNPFYYFDPSAYESIRDTLGSCAVSKPALDYLDEYYRELTARDRALNEENLKKFTPDAIGGFVSEFKGRPFRFNNKQMEAMAWLEANAYSGLMALDTGVGKTLLAGGAMRHYMKTKEAPGSEKQFLFVSPKRLQGNFSREMKDFMTDHGVVDNRIYEMNYTKFAKIVRGIDRVEEFLAEKDPKKRERRLRDIPSDYWKDPSKPEMGSNYADSTEYFKDKYAICFFDEVNEALTGTKRKALSDLKHPRKILLTASAMERDPLDLYRFVAVARGAEFSAEKERAFAERFGNVIGGRFVGLKKGTREEFNTWVKANAYFAFKQDVNLEEIGLPKLQKPTSQVITVRLNERVEKEYRKLSGALARELKAMVKKYRDVIKKGDKYQESSFKNIVDFAQAKSVSKIRDLITLTTNPSKYFNEKVPNPKLDQAEKILMDRPGKAVCYFSADQTIVRQNAVKCSKSGVGGVHVALRRDSIEFYRAGKNIGAIKKDTGKTELSRVNLDSRRFASLSALERRLVDYSFLNAHPKAGEEFREEVQDLFELVEFNLNKYDSVLEEEEKEVIETPFNDLFKALTDKDVKRVKSSRNALKKVYFNPNGVFAFVSEQWAISATKMIFKDNPSIKSISCTDEYAKGFNFQFIGTVVHLDRGEGFDSELVKQRTARAYRTGQNKQVEVIYLDAVIAKGGDRTSGYGDSDKASAFGKDAMDMTIDEMKDLIQGADQDFFMDIIRKGMETDLIADYDSVERTTGESIRINKNLVSMLLDPSASNIKDVSEALENEDENPLKYLALDPSRFRSDPLFSSVIQESKDPSEARRVSDLTGLSSIVSYQFTSDDDFAIIEEGHVLSQSEDINLEVFVEENLDMTRTIYNKALSFSKCLPSDVPSRLIFGQIVSARADKNVSSIKADMDSSDLMTLPSLGFSSDIQIDFLDLDHEVLSKEEIAIKDWLVDNDRIRNGNEVSLSDLFLCTDDNKTELIGQRWWSANGTPLKRMSLSLNDSDVAQRVLNVYFKMKCNEFEMGLSDYLKRPSEPFDVDDASCWESYMSRRSAQDVLEAISTYSNEFKIAYYSNDNVRSMTDVGTIEKLKLKSKGFSKLLSPERERDALTDLMRKSDVILEEAWLSVAKSVERNSLIREKFMDEGDYQTASEFEDKE
jgi:hypothetical protein